MGTNQEWNQLMVYQGLGNPSLHPNPPNVLLLHTEGTLWLHFNSSPTPPHPPVSGLVSSRIRTIPWPCLSVHIFMGEPPPMRLYCF